MDGVWFLARIILHKFLPLLLASALLILYGCVSTNAGYVVAGYIILLIDVMWLCVH